MVIAGGGPAGMMAGLLLARAEIAVTVLEKHADFLRDFRGDIRYQDTGIEVPMLAGPTPDHRRAFDLLDIPIPLTAT